jgi:hypothetical protein
MFDEVVHGECLPVDEGRRKTTGQRSSSTLFLELIIASHDRRAKGCIAGLHGMKPAGTEEGS